MYLKKLELIGFKTFADKTELEFAPGITCIVGPNGSGKSNITDAVRWVLGEQSVKTLRGAKMEEVIFAGTGGRKPLGMAEANIVFDNTDNYLPLEFSDVSVTRRIFRQGETHYSINKSNCRLKDLHELFMGTGLGQGAFCIMSQNEIDMVLSSNSQDRRLILEETAGINKYRFRKKEVNRKLEQTNQNMLRLRDILHEVENQMKELSQQVERYKRYRKYEEKLADYEIRLLKMEIDEANESQKSLTAGKESLLEKIKALDEKMKELENDREKAKRNSLELQNRLDKERKGLSDLIIEAEKSENHVNLCVERQENFQKEEERITGELVDIKKRRETLESRKKELEEETTALSETVKNLEEKLSALLKNFEEKEAEFQKFLPRVKELQNLISSCEKEEASLSIKRETSQETIKKISEEIKKARQELKTLVSQRENIQKEKEKSLALQKDLAKQLESLQEELSLRKKERDTFQSETVKLHSERDRLRQHLNLTQSRIGALEELEKEMAGFSHGIKILISSKSKLNEHFELLSDLLDVPENLETPLEAVMGSHIQDVVVDDFKTAKSLIDFLKDKKAGKITLLPLDMINTSNVSSPLRREGNEGSTGILPVGGEGETETLSPLPLGEGKGEGAGIIGRLADLIKFPEKIRNAMEALIGNVFIVEDLDAIACSARSPNGLSGSTGPSGSTGFQPVVIANEAKQSSSPPSGDVAPVPRTGDVMSHCERSEAISPLPSGERVRVRGEEDLIYVTLEGDVLSKSYIIGGSTKISKGSILSRKREKEQLQKEKESLEKSLLKAEKDYQDSSKNLEKLAKFVEELWQKEGKLKLELASAKNEIESFDLRLQGIESTASKLAESEKQKISTQESLKKEISDAGAKLEEISFSLNKYKEELSGLEETRVTGASDRSTLQEDINSVKVERARALQRKEDSLRALEEVKRNLTESENTAKKLDAEEKTLKKKKSENDEEITRGRNAVTTLRMKIKAGEDMLQSLAEDRETIARQQELLDKEIENIRAQQTEHKEKCHNIDIKEAEYQVEHRDRMSRLKELEAGYAKLLAGLGEEKPSSRKAQTLEKEAIEKEILRLKNFIKNFGSVNLGAMEDYQKHEERYNYLQGQIKDLEDASASLIKVMEEIDEVSAKQFKETFEAVREQFSEVFVKVFGGGQAHLVLSDPDNLLESGVEIVAQPPQRRLQNLALLSSGERALTATAFLLAILKVKPSPFVIFDELDASLDDANVDKVTKILEEFAEKTQFIIITHNRRTMEPASVLYGVTMEEPGVSKIVSVKMEEAIEKLEQEKEAIRVRS